MCTGLGASSLGYASPPGNDRRTPYVFNPQGLEEFGTKQNIVGRVKGWAYWPLQIAVRQCAAAADRVIATDGVLVGPVRQHLDLSEDKVRLIPNAVAIETCASTGSAERATELRASVGLNSRDSLLLSVGRLEANKGFHVLARALGEIAARSAEPDAIQADWKWVLVGTGPLRRKLEQLVARLGLEARVIFTGSVSDSTLHSWYRAATLFVHPTLYEGSSLVTLEAMVHRRAVVATRAGGLPDKVHPGVNGWLVQPGQVAPLAAAIREALSNPERLRKMGEHSRSIVEKHFSWDVAVDRLLQVYEEVMVSGSGSPDLQSRRS